MKTLLVVYACFLTHDLQRSMPCKASHLVKNSMHECQTLASQLNKDMDQVAKLNPNYENLDPQTFTAFCRPQKK